MKTVPIIETTTGQEIHLPREFRFQTSMVSIRREGEAVVLEPVKQGEWPANFFDEIRVVDPAFARPDQGMIPPAPLLD